MCLRGVGGKRRDRGIFFSLFEKPFYVTTPSCQAMQDITADACQMLVMIKIEWARENNIEKICMKTEP